MDIKVGRQAIAEATQKLSNWGRWGKDDQVGTLNHVTPEDIVKAASLIRTGKVFALGIPLDIARFRGVDWLKDGEAISNDELDKCAKDQNVEIRRGDFVIIRTGQMERCLNEKKWGGYAGGDAPGVKFENCYWCQNKEIAAVCSDTWGVEVRPNETTEVNQPWHWVVIPAMGLCMGEIFYLKELAEDCAADGVYEFFFCGPPLIITGGTGSPINPQAIK